MMMTFTERREHCVKNFWMKDWWTVVVKCKECGRHGEACMTSVMGLYGKVKLSYCGSCETLTCAPVLKDHKTVAEVL